VSSHPDPYEPRAFPEPDPDYRPTREGVDWRRIGQRIWAPVALVVGLVVKFGVAGLKFFGIFISVGGYALIWGWKFAVGFVLLILVHELGHFVEAKRQGLSPSLPVFIPFLGAYVAMRNTRFDPWRDLKVSAAGPIAGGLGTLVVYGVAEAQDSRFLLALAYTGFFLNLFNLLPVPPLDGGFMWRAIKVLRHGGGARTREQARGRALAGGLLYAGLALALVVGMVAAHVPQDRL
jgi:Zn-dependent protease